MKTDITDDYINRTLSLLFVNAVIKKIRLTDSEYKDMTEVIKFMGERYSEDVQDRQLIYKIM